MKRTPNAAARRRRTLLGRVSLCWVSLGRVSLGRVSLGWVLLAWAVGTIAAQTPPARAQGQVGELEAAAREPDSSRAAGGTGASGACPVDEGVLSLLDGCGSGSGTEPACALGRLSRILVNADDAESIRAIRQKLGLEASSAKNLLPAFRLLAFFAVGEFEPMSPCAIRVTSQLLGWVQQAMNDEMPIETWLLLWPLTDWDEALIPEIEKTVAPRAAELLRRYREGVETYLAASSHSTAFGQAHLVRPLWDSIAGAGPPTVGRLPAADRQPQGPGPSADDPAPTPSPPNRLAAGVEALGAGRLERAAALFLEEESAPGVLLEKSALGATPQDLRARIRSKLARTLLILTYEELGLEDSAREARARAAAGGDSARNPSFDRILELVSRAVMDEEGVDAEAVLLEVSSYLLGGGPAAAREIEILFSELAGLLPGASDWLGALSLPAPEAGGGRAPPRERELTISAPLGGSFPRLATSVALEWTRGDFEGATRQALELVGRFERSENLGLVFAAVGKQWAAGDRHRALAHGITGLEHMEDLLATMKVADARRELLDTRGSLPFQVVFAMAAELGEVEAAFDAAERGRSWDLRARWGAELGARHPVERSTAELGALEALRQHEAVDPVAELDSSWRARRLALRRGVLQARLERNLKASVGQTPRQILAPPTLEQTRNLLPEGWSLVAYTSHGDRLWAFVVDSRSGTSLVDLGTSLVEVERSFPPSLRPNSTEPEPGESRGVDTPGRRRSGWQNPALARLYRDLLAPLRGKLTGKGLLIVPHGSLVGVPFAALRTETGYLVEELALAQIPSVSALALWSRADSSDTRTGAGGSRTPRIAVFGPPDDLKFPLDGAEREARRVARTLGVAPQAGVDGSESWLKRQSRHLEVLHIATHGEFPVQAPAFSRIRLGPSIADDGWLQFHEVWDDLDLRRARLVVLSGCETGVGENTRAGDVRGLSSAFLAAGSRSVVSTLWRVPDGPSAVLMAEFHRLWSSGTPVAEALRKAQRAMIRRSPSNLEVRDWAGYFSTGDPETRWIGAS